MKCHNVGWPLLAFGMVAIVAGCGSPTAAGAKVSGKVLLKGAPVAGAQVTFYSAQAKGGPSADYSAVTDNAGVFRLGGGNPGWTATPGKYLVSVVKLVPKPGTKLPEPADPEQIIASGMGKHDLPVNYADPANSKLTAELVEGDNDVVLQLNDK